MPSGGPFEEFALVAPQLSLEDARLIAGELFAAEGDVAELASHQDRNFLVTTGDGRQMVLKIANPHFGRAALELQNAAMAHVTGARLAFETPRPLASRDGSLIVAVERDGRRYDVRLLTYLEGTPLDQVGHLSARARAAIGGIAGQVVRALADFPQAGAERALQWDPRLARAVVDGLVRHVRDPARRELVERAMAVHDPALATLAGELRVQVIHGDVTRYNLLGRRDRAGRLVPCGLIDFGDVGRTYLVAELAVALADVAGASSDPVGAMAEVVHGFHRECALSEPELAALFPLTLGRAAAGAVSGEHQAVLAPGNRYVVDSTEVCWKGLTALAALPAALAEAVCRASCGFEPNPSANALARRLASARPCPVVDRAGRHLRTVDLGPRSEAFAFGEWRTPEGLAAAVATRTGELAIGSWGESRLARDEDAGAEEPATVHLGVDVFAGAGEIVRAPLAGVVERRERRALLLRHEPADGPWFWTRLDGIEPTLDEGLLIDRGQPLGTVASPSGPLPAHVHVQLSLAPLDRLPAFARPSHRAAWLSLCPDPSALIGAHAAPRPRDPEQVLAARQRSVARAQRTYYERPPEIVRGWRQRLYDSDGRAYLDMVNNVACVGHSHPHVARAAARQLGLLNTNSRFLYSAMERFATRLTELVPDPLDTVFLVNSGSEANDLALRLARSVTGRAEVIAMEGAYHGWTTATAQISTSPYDTPAAEDERPEWLRVVPAPNPYRGPHGADDSAAAARYADYVRDAARGPAAFICEPQLGNAGGVLPPQGYLAAAFAHVRETGGICVADEVQVGYGRLGRWFWAFEQQGAVPDIVTIAKPAGNGHPLGAVITTRAIADALRPRTSFFSSAGGSPVSCEIGLAVLDVIRDEQLQENAHHVGDRLRSGLDRLMTRHALIGALHGAGLYQGVELVRDRDTKEPASGEAYALCERMLELGVIVQPTGERENVLKIKPPLCIDVADADRFVATLDRVLSEGW